MNDQEHITSQQETAVTEVSAPAQGPPSDDPFDDFVRTVRAAAQDPVIGHRLAFGQTTLLLRVEDDSSAKVFLRLDREPVEVDDQPGDESPEVELCVTRDQLRRIWDPDFHLAMAIAKREASFVGPVRKFLRVMPILHSFWAKERDTQPENQTRAEAGETPKTSEPETP